jgi:hypothetical protein
MITMNRKTRATHRFRGVVAGIVATVMMFGLADLIARAFTPSAAPLLTLGQAIIPLAPPAAIKPVIALFGDNDKLVLVLSTGLGAIVLAGLIGALAVSRRRLATTLLVVAGLVPVIVIIIRPEAASRRVSRSSYFCCARGYRQPSPRRPTVPMSRAVSRAMMGPARERRILHQPQIR